MVITKGDPLDQEAKLHRSGLSGFFKYVEVVSDKNPGVYQRILERYAAAPQHFLMIGNSLKSDILPVLQLGGYAVYVPYALTWSHERIAEGDYPPDRYFEVERLEQLPDLIERIHLGSAPS
jgi:putative hydrolase of the HAD superfamily